MNRPLIIVAAAALVVGLGAALYGMNRGDGNGSTNAACAHTETQRAGLAEQVGGEIAAFQVASAPLDVSYLAFQDESGAAKSIKDFSGSTVLLNLWATWCAPCRREMPALDRLQGEMGGPDFQVVTVNIDTGSFDKPEQFLQSTGVEHLPKFRDPSTGLFQEMRRLGLALGLPATALIDGEGCLLGHLQGPAEWDSENAKALVRAALQPPAGEG